jgi:hypothetical protein
VRWATSKTPPNREASSATREHLAEEETGAGQLGENPVATARQPCIGQFYADARGFTRYILPRHSFSLGVRNEDPSGGDSGTISVAAAAWTIRIWPAAAYSAIHSLRAAIEKLANPNNALFVYNITHSSAAEASL